MEVNQPPIVMLINAMMTLPEGDDLATGSVPDDAVPLLIAIPNINAKYNPGLTNFSVRS